jgi:hypothetical protein
MTKKNEEVEMEEIEEEAPEEEPTPEPEPQPEPEPKPEATKDYKIVNTSNGPMKRYYADNRLEKI